MCVLCEGKRGVLAVMVDGIKKEREIEEISEQEKKREREIVIIYINQMKHPLQFTPLLYIFSVHE